MSKPRRKQEGKKNSRNPNKSPNVRESGAVVASPPSTTFSLLSTTSENYNSAPLPQVPSSPEALHTISCSKITHLPTPPPPPYTILRNQSWAGLGGKQNPQASAPSLETVNANFVPPKFRPTPSRYLSLLTIPNTARDPEFSYDYETYMHHVFKNNANTLKYNRQSDHEHHPQAIFGTDTNPSPAPSAPAPTASHQSIKNSVVIRQCEHPTLAVCNAFKAHSNGYGYGPQESSLIYEVATRHGSPMLYMSERTNCINRLLSCSLVGCSRVFTGVVIDVCGKNSMMITNSEVDCCCSTANKEFKVRLADGEFIGYVCQTRNDSCNPGFLLRDARHHKIIHANGPKCSICARFSKIFSILCSCFSCFIEDDAFYFKERDGRTVAEIRKMRVDFNSASSSEGTSLTKKKESCKGSSESGNDSDEDTSTHQVLLEFAEHLTLEKKALILAAGFVIVGVA